VAGAGAEFQGQELDDCGQKYLMRRTSGWVIETFQVEVAHWLVCGVGKLILSIGHLSGRALGEKWTERAHLLTITMGKKFGTLGGGAQCLSYLTWMFRRDGALSARLDLSKLSCHRSWLELIATKDSHRFIISSNNTAWKWYTWPSMLPNSVQCRLP
jgi:hypothetical protein